MDCDKRTLKKMLLLFKKQNIFTLKFNNIIKIKIEKKNSQKYKS